jgi:LytS/YehU family sensor histidine kinase
LILLLIPCGILGGALSQVALWVELKSLQGTGLIAFPSNWGRYTFPMMLGNIFNEAIMLWLWCAGWFGWQSMRRVRQAEIGKWRAEAAQRGLELEVLKAQINPHFIFNALNNVRAMINEDGEKARAMVTELSNILRHSLYHSRRDLVTLAEEIAVVRDYVALEQIHYEDRLSVEWSLPEAALSTQMPPMLLQLLVENAVKHGVAHRGASRPIAIAAQFESGCLQLCVENDGEWRGEEVGGIGLANLRERLLHAVGPQASCAIAAEGGRVRVFLEIPQ